MSFHLQGHLSQAFRLVVNQALCAVGSLWGNRALGREVEMPSRLGKLKEDHWPLLVVEVRNFPVDFFTMWS